MSDFFIYIIVIPLTPLILLGFDRDIAAIFLQKLSGKKYKSYDDLLKHWWQDRKFRKNTITIILLFCANYTNLISFTYNVYMKLAVSAVILITIGFFVILRFEMLKKDALG